MKYTDEKIISLKMEQKEQIPMSLTEGYYIDGKLESFKKTELLEHILSAFIPESLIDMPPQISELKYPSSYRPQVIKTNIAGNVNFAFNILENPDNLDGKNIASNFQTILQKTNPSIKFYSFNTEILSSGLEATFYDFTSFGVDEQLYNLMCFVVCKGKMVQGIFNCLERDQYGWKNAAKEVLASIDVNKAAL